MRQSAHIYCSYLAILFVVAMYAGCLMHDSSTDSVDASSCVHEALDALPYASEVIEYSPGEGAGFGQQDLPDVVLGPPQGRGTQMGSQDVLSLGQFGEIILGFGDRMIVDRPGADFIVFENPFWPGGNAKQVFAELGEVSVSTDGAVWHTFPCNTEPLEPGRWPGCAGWTPTESYEACQTRILEPSITGGDAFDLSDLGLSYARYVRIRDVSGEGGAPTAGFDLDAVGLIHWQHIGDTDQ